MVEPSSPVVPRDNDCGIRPILTLADGVHDGRDPRWALSSSNASVRRAAWVIGRRAVRNDPNDIGKLSILDVGNDLSACALDHNVGIRIGPVRSAAHRVVRSARGLAHVLNHVGGGPY